MWTSTDVLGRLKAWFLKFRDSAELPQALGLPATKCGGLRKSLQALCLSLLIVLCVSPAKADHLVFGMSTALSGPAEELGRNMKAGVDAAFLEANAGGGVHGQSLLLIALDDGYEPSRTAPNMRKLINQHHVLAVIGNVGTPTAVVAAPIAMESKTLFFGAYTGAGVIRKQPPDRYVINYRASYAEETSAMVESLIKHLDIAPDEFAFFTQRDAYGDAGYIGGIDALTRHGLQDESMIVHCRYERNTDVVEDAVAEILMASTPPRAIIMVGAYKPCATFIRLAQESGVKALFLNVSFVGAGPLQHALGLHADGVIVTQVVPHYESSAPIVSEYRHALSTHVASATESFGSLEGYVVARILLKALRSINGPIDRESIVDALEHLGKFDLGLGNSLEYAPTKHQASHKVWPTVLRPGRIEPLEWPSLATEVPSR